MSSLKVLIVDDEPLARLRLRTLLGDCTSPAVTIGGEAGNAAQAMEMLRRDSYDAALLDVRMPGADGLTLAQALRAMPQAPAVVFVTAHSDHAVSAFELEAVDYLTKPVRLERLQAALQKVERHLVATRGALPEQPQEMLIIQDRAHCGQELHPGRLAQRAGRQIHRPVHAHPPQRPGGAPRRARAREAL
jgi:two-component system response regulator AlgR